jgi:ribose transport system substrate-binding protein
MKRGLVWLSIFCITFFVALFTHLGIREELRTVSSDESLVKDYIYHFALIVPETDSHYWQSFQEGALSFARQNKIALEIHRPSFTNIKEQERLLEFVVLSKVDGVITSVPSNEHFPELINQATNWGIPVVTLDSFIDKLPRSIFYVGIDAFRLGDMAGTAINTARNGRGKVAVIIDPLRSEFFYTQFLKGLKSSLKGHPAIDIQMILRSENGSISAEEHTYNIMMKHPEIDTIFCINAKDTIGVTRVVIDLNRVNSTTIIGSGLNPDISRYIDRGVIYGTICTNPFYLGVRSVAVLQAAKEGWFNHNLNETEVSFVTQTNLQQYQRDYHLGGL